MSQSPREALRLQRYLNGWEIINRMIREETSWGGRERNCFHLSCADGTFADVSAASRIDFLEDGRALARLDFDRDGRPDLILRNRSAPQLRFLRNRWPHAGRALWVRPEGRRSNRSGIGAQVLVETEARNRIQEVTAGRAFLSQSSRWLAFGLAGAEHVRSVRVRWPGGDVEDFGALDPSQRWRLVEGESARSEPFAGREDSVYERLPPGLDAAEPTAAAEAGSATETWLVEPMPAPPLAGRTRQGDAFRIDDFRGEVRFVHFVSHTCPACRSEVPSLARSAPLLRARGASLVLVSLDVDSTEEEALGFLDAMPPAAPRLRIEPGSLTAWNISVRHLFNWRRDLVVPTTLLVDRDGAIAKVYRGRVDPATFLEDLERIPRTREDRLRLGLPYPGRLLRDSFARDPLELGNAFFEAGMPELAARTYAGGSSARPGAGDVDSLFNYAVSMAQAGNPDEARKIYEDILSARPDFDDARNNLGILEARAGRIAAARAHFTRVLQTNPAHTEAALNLANTFLETHGADEDGARRAAAIYRELLEHDPESAPALRMLGYALYRAGELEESLRVHRRALRIDPLDMDAYLNLAIILNITEQFAEARSVALGGLEAEPRHPGLRNALGMALKGLGRFAEAEAELWKAIGDSGELDLPYLNLARLHIENGEPEKARAVIERLLAVSPGHPEARELLQRASAAAR